MYFQHQIRKIKVPQILLHITEPNIVQCVMCSIYHFNEMIGKNIQITNHQKLKTLNPKNGGHYRIVK